MSMKPSMQKIYTQGTEIIFRHVDGELISGWVNEFDMLNLLYEIFWQRQGQDLIWKSYVNSKNIIATYNK